MTRMTFPRKLPVLIVGGVALSGKTTLAKGIVQASPVSAEFIEGDSLHEETSIEKMRFGTPLDESDRSVWKTRICHAIEESPADRLRVITCSALSRSFRDDLRACGELRFVFLLIRHEVARQRAQRRFQDTRGHLQYEPGHRPHYFQPALYPELLEGQFRDLEAPRHPDTPGHPEHDCLILPAEEATPHDDKVAQVLHWLGL